MSVNYNKLWKLLIDKGIKRSQLCSLAGVTTNAIAKMGKNEEVRLEVLTKICTYFGCTLDDIVEIVTDDDK